MHRAIAPILAVAFLFPAQSALACGMYIPPEVREEVKLTDLLEDIDKTEDPTVADEGSLVDALEAMLEDATVQAAEAAAIAAQAATPNS